MLSLLSLQETTCAADFTIDVERLKCAPTISTGTANAFFITLARVSVGLVMVAGFLMGNSMRRVAGDDGR